MSFWPYAPQDDAVEPNSESLGAALFALHASLEHIRTRVDLSSFDDELTDTLTAIDRPGFAALLGAEDRQLLGDTLRAGVATLTELAGESKALHGSLHRLNVVVINDTPRFIDFETVALGPVEWDLARAALEGSPVTIIWHFQLSG